MEVQRNFSPKTFEAELDNTKRVGDIKRFVDSLKRGVRDYQSELATKGLEEMLNNHLKRVAGGESPQIDLIYQLINDLNEEFLMFGWEEKFEGFRQEAERLYLPYENFNQILRVYQNVGDRYNVHTSGLTLKKRCSIALERSARYSLDNELELMQGTVVRRYGITQPLPLNFRSDITNYFAHAIHLFEIPQDESWITKEDPHLKE